MLIIIVIIIMMMEYQKIRNQWSKFRTRDWVEINDESKGTYLMFLLIIIYSDAYIFVKRTTTIWNTAASGIAANNTEKKVIFKNCAPFTECITEINNTQIDDAQKIDVVLLMYNLTEYRDAYSKTSKSLR